MKKALLFDFDNTMLGTERGNLVTFDRMMNEKFGHSLKDEDYAHFYGHAWKYIFDYVAEKYGDGMSGDNMRSEFLDRKAIYFRKHGVKMADGLYDVLNLPVKKAIVTGSSLPEIKLFSDIIDFSLFDALVTDETTVEGKPHPAPYLKALEALGIDACDAMAVEDSRIGITSARSAGVFTCFSRQFADEDHTQIADMAVDSIKDISF